MRELRAATAEQAARLWPAVRASRLFVNEEEFARYRLADPWRVRASHLGDGAVLGAWRGHLEVLAIRGLWCGTDRMGRLLGEIAAVASDHGYRSVLSPLVPTSALKPYQDAGFRVAERLVVFQAPAEQLAVLGEDSVDLNVEYASCDDVAQLATVDAWCFDSLWRYGASEIEEALRLERVVVARDPAGAIAGYATASHHGATVTVGRLAVAPEQRRQGVATALLGDCARWACQQGALGVTLCTQEHNEGSRALYQAAGMRELGEHYALAVIAS